MFIKWLGHASFLIEIAGQKLVTDPFDDKLGYPVYKQEVDITTVSHDHWDHNAVGILKGSPAVVKKPGVFNFGVINITGVESFHDKSQGSERGKNIIYKISAEGLDLVHLGDLGHTLTPEQVNDIGNTDILLVPVGGTFTVDAEEAFKVVEQLHPHIVIPMHFNTPHLSFELAPVEAFTSRFPRAVKVPHLEITSSDFKNELEVIVLDYL
ncbi:MAG: MBL fold metallo-hydrolase [Syntrophomonadaceae bacterium]|nr:MBL fold metallo-hydrolase [Syntrophomonadaceae bacterium]MDD3888607.1 MBL fold metallo-hydrolase [Syntrophomonadaceae bacterium]MDD4549166.1 MBL fold metallo-hydrolase [Syntrophomonadaceae bacterium]